MCKENNVVIDQSEYEIEDILDGDVLLTTCWEEYRVFESSHEAGEKAKEYWKELAEYDSEEFTCIVWKDNLVSWCLWRYGWPWNEKTKSLDDWFDLHIDYPEEYHASYDSTEREVNDIGDILSEQLGFIPTVAYRMQ